MGFGRIIDKNLSLCVCVYSFTFCLSSCFEFGENIIFINVFIQENNGRGGIIDKIQFLFVGLFISIFSSFDFDSWVCLSGRKEDRRRESGGKES